MNRSGRGKSDRAARAEGGRQEGRSQGRGKYGSRPTDRSLSFQHKVPLPGSEILRYEFGSKRNHRAWRDFMTTHMMKKFGQHGSFMETGKLWLPTKPTVDPSEIDPANDVLGIKLEELKIRMRQYYAEIQKVPDINTKMFSEIISQISETSEERTLAHPEYATKANVGGEKNPLELISIVDDVHINGVATNDMDRQRNARRAFATRRQQEFESLSSFKNTHDLGFKVMQAAGCIEAQMTDEMLADDFLHKLHPKYYGNAVAKLDQNRQLGLTGYPKTVAEAYTLLSQWAHEPVVNRPVMSQDTVFSADMKFSGKSRKQESQRKTKDEKYDFECYKCGKKGHMAKECWSTGGGKEGQKPKSSNNGGGKEGQKHRKENSKKEKAADEDVKCADVMFHDDIDCDDEYYCYDIDFGDNDNDELIVYPDGINYDLYCSEMHAKNNGVNQICSAGRHSPINPEMDYIVYIDSCATGAVIRNVNLVSNVRPGRQVRIHPITDGAKSVMAGNLWGDLEHFDRVHFNSKARSNILSEGLLKIKGYSISREEEPEDAVIVTSPDGHTTRFVRPQRETRWWCNFRKQEEMFMTTVEDNMRKYTKREVEKAREARDLQEKMNFPGPNVMIEMVKRHMDNPPVTTQDIARADDIWGPNVAALKGKTTQRKSGYPPEEEFLPRRLNPVPQDLLADLMYVDSDAYLITRTKQLRLRMIESLASRSSDEITKALKNIVKLYAGAGYKLVDLYSDKEGGVAKAFSNVDCSELLFMKLITDGWGKHVPEIERDIRTTKERLRCILHSLPYKPCKQIKDSLVKISGTAVNGEPQAGSHDDRSPREIFLNRRMNAKLDLRVAPGTYCQITAHDTDNSMKARTLDAIALEPLRNNKGSYRFF